MMRKFWPDMARSPVHAGTVHFVYSYNCLHATTLWRIPLGSFEISTVQLLKKTNYTLIF
jgi:hypothetical protein